MGSFSNQIDRALSILTYAFQYRRLRFEIFDLNYLNVKSIETVQMLNPLKLSNISYDQDETELSKLIYVIILPNNKFQLKRDIPPPASLTWKMKFLVIKNAYQFFIRSYIIDKQFFSVRFIITWKMTFLVIKNASLVYSLSKSKLSFQSNRCLVVEKASGKIIANFPQEAHSQLQPYEPYETLTLKKGQIIIPGLVDCHVHAPQFSFVGTGLDLPLLEWLRKYTFPNESRFENLDFAHKAYQSSVNSHLRNGTTTICYFATLHLPASILLAQMLQAKGMRGFVGKVCMDTNSPGFYCESSTETSLKETREFIQHLKDTKSSVTPVITPRFAPTCTSALMHGLGNISQELGVPIQTHLSENREEISWVRSLFPEFSSYAQVYEKHGLLTDKTVLAHCVHVTDPELELIKKQGSGISHCPNSNTSLVSGAMPTRKIFDKGIKLGLGTDVAGGYSCSIFNAIRECIGVSKLRYATIDHNDDQSAPITLAEAFWMATRGGAELFSLEKQIGVLEPGWEFDALLLDTENLDVFVGEDESLEDLFEKAIYTVTHHDIQQIWIKGNKVYQVFQSVQRP